ncbi:MAG: hypothetical protein OXU51_13850 [Candidatus Poribacteria bacterium]|nr:hypothetical protein [Candidatus Poribacteria bacterium]
MFVTTKKERILNLKGIQQISIIAIAFSFLLFVKPTSAQLMNLHELPEGELAYSFGYVYNNSPIAQECNGIYTGVLGLDYGYHDNLKVSFMPSLAWGDDALSPGFKLRFMHIGETRSPYIGYFFRSDWSGVGLQCSDSTVIDLSATTSFSVFGRIINDPAWEIKPFLGISQSTDYYIPIATNEKSDSGFITKAEVGIELEIGKNFSVLGSWEFVFNDSDSVIHIGVNLHY